MQQEAKLEALNQFIKIIVPIGIISAVTWLVYSSSLSVPFYLDDYSSITNNPRFDGADYLSIFNNYGLRFLGYLGLWLNYEYAKLDVFSYHAVNVTIHMLTGIAVFFLTLKLVQISKALIDLKHQIFIACIVALLFICHPLQSQGVTYIVQRLASQVALFYVATIASYLYFRTASSNKQKIFYFLLSGTFAVCALFTKQNAFSLPLIILMTEWVMFRSIERKHVYFSLVVVCILLVAGALFANSSLSFLTALDNLTRETKDITRLDYFLAQQPILWDYISKIFWPWPLQLEYDLTIESFSTWAIALSALGHVLLLTCAIVYRKKLPVIAWGIFFYYVAHAIESSVIPIRDIAFEHRAYLPNVGAFLAITFSCFTLFDKVMMQHSKLSKAFAFFLPVVLLLTLSLLTIARNHQWQNPDVFFSHDLELAPNQPRAIHNYAELKLKEGDLDGSIKLLERLFDLDSEKVNGIMYNTYLAAMIASKQYEKALEDAFSMLEQPIGSEARSIINSNVGVIYTNLKRYDEAIPYFRKAYKLGRLPSNSLIAYAYSSFVMKEYKRSAELCKEILQREPQHQKAKILLSMIMGK